jgi:gluconolactonase
MKKCTFAARTTVTLLAMFVSGASIVSAGASTVPWGAAERVATGFQFTEGPVWSPDGFLLFSDVQGNRIVRWTAPDETTTFRQPSGNSNGLIFDSQGRLVACEHSNRRVSRTELDGNIVTLADRYQGMRLNSPNDIAIKSDGSIYFTDPPYGISSGQQELPYNGVFRISQPRNELTLLSSDFDRPNGLAFSPDESKLYIADTSRGHIRVFDVEPDGTIQGGAVFVEVSSPDGMKVDAKGRLYVASSTGVRVFTANGETFGTIAVAEQPSNLCFGDADGKSLFVTARTSLYRVRLSDGDISSDSKKNLSITWTSMPGKVYSIYRSNDLLSWELAADDVPSGAEMFTRWTDPSRPLLSPEVVRLFYEIAEKQ